VGILHRVQASVPIQIFHTFHIRSIDRSEVDILLHYWELFITKLILYIDSPKLSGRQGAANARRVINQKRNIVPRRIASLNSATAHNIVVVKEAKTPQTSDKDEDLLRLQVCI